MGTQSVYGTTGFRGFTRLARTRSWSRPTPHHDLAVVSCDRVLGEMIHHAAAVRGFTCRIDGMPTGTPLSLGRRERASIVVLDMDHLDLHVTEAVRRMAEQDTLVIVVGSEASEHTQVRALQAGAIDFIPKPLSVAVLVAKIEQHIARTP